MRSSTGVASVVLAATLPSAACGSDDSGTGDGDGTLPSAVDTTPETTVESTPDTTTATSEPDQSGQDVEADAAAAEAALITATELPEGWAGRVLASLTFENRSEATPVETIDEFTALAAARLPA